MATWTWFGASGQPYQFGVFDKYAHWNDVSGVYIFASYPGVLGVLNFPAALYVGQCSSFSSRICGHERWGDALLHGANEVHGLVIHRQSDLDFVELDLIRALRPILNRQHVGLTAGEIYGFPNALG
jgi:hypothetical protein